MSHKDQAKSIKRYIFELAFCDSHSYIKSRVNNNIGRTL